jgi:hypothetical protein
MQLSASRLVVLTVGTGSIVFVIFLFWLRSPLIMAVLGGAIFGTVFTMVAASLGDDPLLADAAWRAEATDLIGGSTDPSDDVLPGESAAGGLGPGATVDDLLDAADPAAALPSAGPDRTTTDDGREAR